MGSEKSAEIARRTTGLSASSNNVTETKANSDPKPLTVGELVFKGETLSPNDLISSLPGRRNQILELISLLGPVNSPLIPLFVNGGVSTGKTSTILQIFRHLKRPFVYVGCRTCYSPRILFESVINQLLLHKKNEGNGYLSVKRCEKPSDFVYYVRDALVNVVNGFKENMEKLSSKKPVIRAKGHMVYLIIDKLELVRDWDKSASILPFLFMLHDILKILELEDDICLIFMRNQSNSKLYSSFFERIDELSPAFLQLFKKYCEPLDDSAVIPTEEMKRRLFSHLQVHIASSLNETFRVTPLTLNRTGANVDKNKQKTSGNKLGFSGLVDEMDFHMSICAKYLLIFAFLASRNAATLDASLFDSTGGSDTRKRKRKVSETSKEQKEITEQELLMKGPGTLPLERLLAIFQCITPVAKCSLEENEQGNREFGGETVSRKRC